MSEDLCRKFKTWRDIRLLCYRRLTFSHKYVRACADVIKAIHGSVRERTLRGSVGCEERKGGLEEKETFFSPIFLSVAVLSAHFIYTANMFINQ